VDGRVLALLMALIEQCVENLTERTDDVLQVPIPDLAHRVLSTYWRQVRSFDGCDLIQVRGSTARITTAAKALRAAARAGDGGLSLLGHSTSGYLVGSASRQPSMPTRAINHRSGKPPRSSNP
jgi:hypothetical protein